MATTWILTAESSRAIIYAMESRIKPLKEIESLDHPEGRAREQDLTSDRPGRTVDAVGRHAVGKEVDPKRHEAQLFALRLAERLDQGRTHGQFNHLILIAPPEFLGILRHSLNDQTLKLVSQSLDKNLVQKSELAVRNQLFS
ncbi:MAG: host attachment protein [Methylococcaceae bacterium]|nr:MAG: host attachment protein [Methylococcaceae bacterium]